jgi:geranylgeranyl pyrophosphate synthase
MIQLETEPVGGVALKSHPVGLEQLLLSSVSETLDPNLESLISTILPDHGHPLAEIAKYHFSLPGKNLRARFALDAGRTLQLNHEAVFQWASAVEILHNASLVHDDICDGDKYRRGQISVWNKFGSDIALTFGDWLIGAAFQLAGRASQLSDTPTLVQSLAAHMQTTTRGQAREFDVHAALYWETYLATAKDKTGPLLTAPIEGIALMSSDHASVPTIRCCFDSIGAAYQLSNDVFNFSSQDGRLEGGADLARRLPNAVVVLFRQGLNEAALKDFDKWYLSGDEIGREKWLSRIRDANSIAGVEEHVCRMLEEADTYATLLPSNLEEVVRPILALIENTCLNTTNTLSNNADTV